MSILFLTQENIFWESQILVMFYKASKIEISELATYTEVKSTCFFAPRKTKLLCFGIVFIHANEFWQYLKVTTDFAKQTISPLLPSALEDANVWWGVGTVSVSVSLTVPFQQFPNAHLHFKPSLFLSVSESCPPLALMASQTSPILLPHKVPSPAIQLLLLQIQWKSKHALPKQPWLL